MSVLEENDDDAQQDECVTSSLEQVGYDCIWEVCLYLGSDYSTVAALAQTCRTMYAYCTEEYIWRNIASLTLPQDSFRQLDVKHMGLLTSARADERRRFRAQQRAGLNLFGDDVDELSHVGNGDLTDMSRYLPGYFRDQVRGHVLRSVTRNIQLFVEAAMAGAQGTAPSECNASTMLTLVKKREGDLRGYFATARDISFPQSCIGRAGATLLASSLSLCCDSDLGVCYLTRLDLSNQLMRDQGAESLFAALIGSRGMLHSLRTVLLGNNKLTDALAVWLGNFIFHSVSRGGALQELDVRDNPNLSEEVIVHAVSGLGRAMFGTDDGQQGSSLLGTSIGLRNLLLDCERVGSDNCAAWSRIAFRRLVLNGTHAGRSRGGGDAKSSKEPTMKKVKPIDFSTAPYNTSNGQAALCQLLGCFALIAASTTQTARTEYHQALLRFRAAQRGRKTSSAASDAIAFVSKSGRGTGASTVRLALQDAGFGHKTVSACVEYLVVAVPQQTADCTPTIAQATDKNDPLLAGSALNCLYSVDFGASQPMATSHNDVDNVKSSLQACDQTPNDQQSVFMISAKLQQLPLPTQAGVKLLFGVNENSMASSAPSSLLAPEGAVTARSSPPPQPKVVLGQHLSWEVRLPPPPPPAAAKKKGKSKDGGCNVM